MSRTETQMLEGTLAEVRRRFDEALVQEKTGAPAQVDVVSDDGETLTFYLYLTNEEALAVSVDLPRGAGPAFVEHCAQTASRWHWLH